MKRVMFVCHGNICRSPLAEFIMKDLVEKRGLFGQFFISSSGVSSEELGNPIYPPVKRLLRENGIPFDEHYATTLKSSDYENFDFFILMDSSNLRNIKRYFPNDRDGKIHLLLEYTGENRDVYDPWYSRNFDEAYRDILNGCTAFLDYLSKDTG